MGRGRVHSGMQREVTRAAARTALRVEAMRLKDGRMDVMVDRDDPGSFVELQIAGGSDHSAEQNAGGAANPHVIRLTREEARRVAALILFQAERLRRPLRKSA